MAKVFGPLHSDQASGTIAGQLTFRHTNGVATCRKKGRSTRPLSENQRLHHLAFSMLSTSWRSASTADKTSWAVLADPDAITNYAAYIRFNFQRMADGLALSTIYPPPATAAYDIRISAGSPAPAPDCTGDYTIIGQHNGAPVYGRLSDTRFILTYRPSFSTWFLIDDQGGEDPAIWTTSPGPAGEYTPESPAAAGVPIVSLP